MREKLKSIFCNKTFIYLLLIIMFGAWLRLINLDKPSGMWLDEVFVYNYAEQSFPFGILAKLYNEIHPPLYHFIIHFWMKLFGSTDYILRLLSVIFGILNIPIIYLAGKELNSKNTGLIAALLLSINSLFIYYSQEVRPYSLLPLLCTLSIYLMIKAINNPNKGNYTGLALINTAILYVHYLAYPLVFFQSCIILFYLIYKDRKNLKLFIFSQFLILLLYFPYIPSSIHQIRHSGEYIFIWYPFNFWKLLFILDDWFSPIMLNLTLSPADFNTNLITLKSIFFTRTYFFSFIQYFIIFGIIPILIYLFGIIKGITASRKALTIFILGLLAYLFIIISAMNNKIVFESRFTTFLLPIFILTASYGFSRLKIKWLKVFLIGSLTFLNLFYIISNPFSAPKIDRFGGCKSSMNMTNKYNFDSNSMIIIDPVFYEILKKYNLENKKKLQIVNFDSYPLIYKILDPNNKYNRQDIFQKYNLVKDYLLSNQIPAIFKDYFDNYIQKKIKKGSYLAISYNGNIENKQKLDEIASSDKLYCSSNVFDVFAFKGIFTLNQLTAQNFKLISIDRQNGWTVYIYKKIR